MTGRSSVKKEKQTPVKTEKQNGIKLQPVSPTTLPVKNIKRESVKAEKKPQKRTNSEPLSQSSEPATKKKKKNEEEENVYRWWDNIEACQEAMKRKGRKWQFLEWKGPQFPPDYVPLPPGVNFYFDSQPMQLSLPAEEIAVAYGKMLDHDYTEKKVFNTNFFCDWRKYMTADERKTITRLDKCNFEEINTHFKEQTELKKNRSKEEKKAEKEVRDELAKTYGYCTMDDHKEKLGNYTIEPPGLFRGRGAHPRMGKWKRRVLPKDVTINCSKGAQVPDPPEGHKWKKVIHDQTVSWLAHWKENINDNTKYIMLNPASRLKGVKDWMKYEIARSLHQRIDKIRDDYTRDLKDSSCAIRQRATAMYFMDKLALRAGNEKDEDEADTVGCCSLRCEHIHLSQERVGGDGGEKRYMVKFDFLGKDSIRYENTVAVDKQVYKNLNIFLENKDGPDDLFDRLNTSQLNTHLQSIMPGLTIKYFRTYNASITLERQLDKLMTGAGKGKLLAKEMLLRYNNANRQVAILCNHQRAVPKTFDKAMETMNKKIADKQKELGEMMPEYKKAKTAYKQAPSDSKKEQVAHSDYLKMKKKKDKLDEQLRGLEIQMKDKDDNKSVSLGTSKLNYLDPRITVAFCKKYGLPIEKVFSKTHRLKFKWAIDMADETYRFSDPPQTNFHCGDEDNEEEDEEEEEGVNGNDGEGDGED